MAAAAMFLKTQQCFAKTASRTGDTTGWVHPSWWLPEILAQAGGILCLITITIILWRVDGGPPPEWGFGITLNTVLAFLSSVTKVLFLIPIVECLSQLKWVWFLSPKYRPLVDIQAFDEATKGGLGGVKLLFYFKGFLPSFGALTMISGLFTSTLTQQAISYPLFEAVSTNPDDIASVDRATSFSTYDGDTLTFRPYDATRQSQALFKGALSPPSEPAPHITPTCSSAKCTWPLYSSLAICSDVVSLTATTGSSSNNNSLLDFLRLKTARRLDAFFASTLATSANQLAAVPAVFPVLQGVIDRPTGSFNSTVINLMTLNAFLGYSDEIINTTSDGGVLLSEENLQKLKFLEIGFWWCTKTYRTSVDGGSDVTTEVAARSELAPTGNSANKGSSRPGYKLNARWAPDLLECYTNRTCNATYGDAEVELLQGGERYAVNVWSALIASASLRGSIAGAVIMDARRGVVAANPGGGVVGYALGLLGHGGSVESPSPEQQMANAKAIAENVARELTNLIRGGQTRQGKGHGMYSDELAARGTVIVLQPFVKIKWQWLGLLVAQLALTTIFLALTVLDTHRREMQVIKSSSLATLCALDDTTRRRVGGMVDLAVLNARARCLGVRLETGPDGMAVGLVSDSERGGDK